MRKQSMNTSFLDIFGLPPKSKLVLIDIIDHGVSSVAVISRRLNMPKSSVYDAVTPLLEQSLINEYSEGNGKTFGISDSGQLARAHKEKIEEMQKAQASLLSFIGSHHAENKVLLRDARHQASFSRYALAKGYQGDIHGLADKEHDRHR